MGEVHTGLLQNSSAVTPDLTESLLEVALGQRVRGGARPIAYAISPEILTGVDCSLPASKGARPRAIGTAASHTVITGGHIVQGHSRVRIVAGGSTQRQPWSHYLARPGVLEVLGKADTAAIADGFLTARGAPEPETLDLTAISRRAMDSVQLSEKLDHRVPFKAGRTQLRWAIADSGGSTQLIFAIRGDTVRTASLPASETDVEDLTAWSEDLALHDWLLSTLLSIVERSRIGTGTRQEVVRRLAPAIDYLLHLWMPSARTSDATRELWESLEQHPGFTRQWQSNVARIRDQLTLASLSALPAHYSTKV